MTYEWTDMLQIMFPHLYSILTNGLESSVVYKRASALTLYSQTQPQDAWVFILEFWPMTS